jgi:hypothetical protein
MLCVSRRPPGAQYVKNMLKFPNCAIAEMSAVKRLEVLELFELAQTLAQSDAQLRQDKIKMIDAYVALTSIRDELQKFHQNQAAFPLTRGSAIEAIAAIHKLLQDRLLTEKGQFREGLSFDEELSTWTLHEVKTKLEEFRHVFAAECRKSETYFIEQKMGFDISSLLHTADQNLHSSVLPVLALAAVDEIKSAGRCFALENYTACGFHTLRALEVVMADYYKLVSGKEKEFRSWYDYIEEFTKLEKSRTRRGSKFP